MLTPAISVLSAVEGLAVGTSAFEPYIVPIAMGILIVLFAIQRFGTGVVGVLFGPVCLLWFASLAVVGIWNIATAPVILGALNPAYALRLRHRSRCCVVHRSQLGAACSYRCRGAVRRHGSFWRAGDPTSMVWRRGARVGAELLGQGALLIRQPDAIVNPFFLSYPSWALYPMVALATAATVIASQATISGAYSMTQQAIQLGYLPRMTILHTSATTRGQIYMPGVNWTLLAIVAAAVVGFSSSSRLASAYGVAVMGTMFVTTLLTFFVLRYDWRYPLWLCVLPTAFFMLIDGTFFAAAMHKILDGGWFPLALGAIVFSGMVTWRRGRELLLDRLRNASPPLVDFLKSLLLSSPQRVPGVAVFLTSTPNATPNALLHSLKHYKVLHDQNVFLTVEFGTFRGCRRSIG